MSKIEPDTESKFESPSGEPLICMVTTTYPPEVDGIADYAAIMVRHFLPGYNFMVLCPSIEGVSAKSRGPGRVENSFSNHDPRTLLNIPPLVQQLAPSWFIIQYNGYAFGGRFGLNSFLPRMLRQIRRRSPGTRIATVVHEAILPITSLKRAALFGGHLTQLSLMGRYSDLVLFSTETWSRRFGLFVGINKSHHCPIPSNIPMVRASRNEVRAELGVSPESFVCCLFGRARPAKALYLLRAAVEKLMRERVKVVVLYLGAHCQDARDALEGLPLIAKGPLPADEISRMLQSVDLYVVPLDEGVSTRRTTLMVAMEHGLPILATRGPATDPMLLEQHDKCFVLEDANDSTAFAEAAFVVARDSEKRLRLGTAAQKFYRTHFDVSVLAAKFKRLFGSP